MMRKMKSDKKKKLYESRMSMWMWMRMSNVDADDPVNIKSRGVEVDREKKKVTEWMLTRMLALSRKQ
jgi:hypothetical protein